MIIRTDQELKEWAEQVCLAALELLDLPEGRGRAPKGRQNDPGANLKPAGVLIIPLFTDPAVPGAVFGADLVELKRKDSAGRPAPRLGVHRVVTVRDGDGGNRANVEPVGDGTIPAIVRLLAGHALPGVVGEVTRGGDPLRKLGALFHMLGDPGGGPR